MKYITQKSDTLCVERLFDMCDERFFRCDNIEFGHGELGHVAGADGTERGAEGQGVVRARGLEVCGNVAVWRFKKDCADFGSWGS